MDNQPKSLNRSGFMRLRDVLAVIPVGKSTWWAGVKTGRFPKPVKLGPNTTAWTTEKIIALMDEIESQSDASR